MEPQTEAARTWTLPETHTLLDLIQDMGFTQALTRKGYQNWEVFERLCALLSRCNIQVSSVEVKSHWQTLKAKFLSVKRLVTMGLIRVPGIAVEFPFYEEMEQLLTPQSKTRSCKREADSSVSDLEGQNFPSSALSVSGMLSHNEGQAASSSNQEADEGAGLVREAPLGDLSGNARMFRAVNFHRRVVILRRTIRQLFDSIERLEHLCGVAERPSVPLDYMCSDALQMTHQP